MEEDKDCFNYERLKGFHKNVVDVVLQYMLDPNAKGVEERKARLTDIGYGLSLVLALHIKLVVGMNKEGQASEERLIGLVDKTLRTALADKSLLIGFPKDLVDKYSLGNSGSPSPRMHIEEVTKEEIDKYPPRPIVELASWMAKEVYKSLIKEGVDLVGSRSLGEVHFTKDNDGKMREVILRVRFTRKEDGNEGHASKD